MTILLCNSLSAHTALIKQEHRVLLAIFLAGIKAELERELGLELLRVEARCADVTGLLRGRKPCTVLFDLGLDSQAL